MSGWTANCPGGSGGLQGRAVALTMASEFGLDPRRLSALNLFYEYVESTPGADERYRVRGGNDQIVAGLAERLPGNAVERDAPLEALWRRGDGTYAMRFRDLRRDVVADRVALCLPFTTLREVDLAGAGLSRRKRACIAELGMGTNAKLILQFDRRPDAYGDWNGALYNDRPRYVTWQSSLREPGAAGLITLYFGGHSGGAGLEPPRPHQPAPPAIVDRALATLGRAGATRLPGLTDGFNGRAWVDHWAADRWSRGSYAAFLPGQYTRFYGFAGRSEGGLHFGGEQTALANQGYLEGAVRSGERCADEIVRALRKTTERHGVADTDATRSGAA